MKTVVVHFEDGEGGMDVLPLGSVKASVTALKREGWREDHRNEGEVAFCRKNWLWSGDFRRLHLLLP